MKKMKEGKEMQFSRKLYMKILYHFFRAPSFTDWASLVCRIVQILAGNWLGIEYM